MTDTQRAWAALISSAIVAVICGYFASKAPHCPRNAPPGPTIGHVLKLYGC